ADQLAAAAGAEEQSGARQHFLAAPLLTQVRLQQWSLVQDNPDSGLYFRGLTHFAMGRAHAARGDVAAARMRLQSLQHASRAARDAGLKVKNVHRSSDVLTVAALQLLSGIATASNRSADAVRFARAAVAAEDRLVADDPPVWPLPSRHMLGEALLRADRFAEARKVFGADLKRYPQNCVALAGVDKADRARLSVRASLHAAHTSAHLSHCSK
ncbi:MAG TPA: hypothetical protein VM937_06470, partial [Burkholderiaceae bacterium]|nr:hypothetical protein [Burkholderiaceae bacterium]